MSIYKIPLTVVRQLSTFKSDFALFQSYQRVQDVEQISLEILVYNLKNIRFYFLNKMKFVKCTRISMCKTYISPSVF